MACTQFKKGVTFVLILALFACSSSFASADAATHDAMKAKIVSRGEGHGVRVTLADKSDVKGTVVAIHEQDFVLKTKGPGGPRTIEYAQLTRVQKDQMSTGTKVAICVGVGVVVIVVFVGIALARVSVLGN